MNQHASPTTATGSASTNWVLRIIYGLIAMMVLGAALGTLKSCSSGHEQKAPSAHAGGASTAGPATDQPVSSAITDSATILVPGSDSNKVSVAIDVAIGKKLCTDPLNATIEYRPNPYQDNAPDHWFTLPAGGQVYANAFRYKGKEPGDHLMRKCLVSENEACPRRCPEA